MLKGTFAQNRLEGGAGGDVLQGHGGSDTYNGGAGADIFVFQTGFGGAEVIEDFDEFNPSEKIDLSLVAGITDLADLAANHLAQNGSHAEITDGLGKITLHNVLLTNLDAGDFIF